MKMPADAIREEISQSGEISFARFMELALYCPETGYYEAKKDTVGQRGDFITSVSTGPLFGQLLAFQFAEWLESMHVRNCGAHSEDCSFSLIEAGAHAAQLAGDILNWLQSHRQKLFERIDYIIVEPSPRRREWQREGLAKFGDKVRWVSTLSEIKKLKSAILFSNELLDAFPIHRFGWDAEKKQWYEWGVTNDGEQFRWAKLERPVCGQNCSPPSLPAGLLEVLPDNYIVETSPAAEAWWREAAEIFDHGKLLAIDYGHSADEIISPSRLQGTLRAYHRHQVTTDVLANPGEQDLTAHVNFSAIQNAGEGAGLRTEQFCTQPQFLTGILKQAVARREFVTLDVKQIRQFQMLTHPEHLGRAFRVLVQAR